MYINILSRIIFKIKNLVCCSEYTIQKAKFGFLVEFGRHNEIGNKKSTIITFQLTLFYLT